MIWSHTSMQNNDEDSITKQWRGSLRLFAHIHIYILTYTHIHILTYIYIHTHTYRYIYTYTYILHAMYSNRLFWAPVNCAARNPTAKSRGSREPRDQTCMLIVSPRNLTGNSAELLSWCPSNLRAIGKNLKLESRSPGTPQNPAVGQPVRPAEKRPRRTSCGDVNMTWRQKYHVTSAVHNVTSFASLSQWVCRSASQPGRNRPDACSIEPTPVRHRSATAGPQDSGTGMHVLHDYSNM